MSNELSVMLKTAPVVPLVQAESPAVAVRTAEALLAGGLAVIEVVLRTEAALDCLQAVATECPGAVAGAGTVLNREQAEAALEVGSQFIVSPGLDEAVVRLCQERNVPVYPGIYTPTELQRAGNLGLDIVKFFPAVLAGGVPALKVLSGVFREIRFMPTGGISPDNLADFLALPAVVACGGSWLTPADAIDRGEFEVVTRLAREALSIAERVRELPPA